VLAYLQRGLYHPMVGSDPGTVSTVNMCDMSNLLSVMVKYEIVELTEREKIDVVMDSML
jgi:hypothetical protein